MGERRRQHLARNKITNGMLSNMGMCTFSVSNREYDLGVHG